MCAYKQRLCGTGWERLAHRWRKTLSVFGRIGLRNRFRLLAAVREWELFFCCCCRRQGQYNSFSLSLLRDFRFIRLPSVSSISMLRAFPNQPRSGCTTQFFLRGDVPTHNFTSQPPPPLDSRQHICIIHSTTHDLTAHAFLTLREEPIQ